MEPLPATDAYSFLSCFDTTVVARCNLVLKNFDSDLHMRESGLSLTPERISPVLRVVLRCMGIRSLLHINLDLFNLVPWAATGLDLDKTF